MNDTLNILRDSPENQQQVKRTVDFLTQGCRCKTGCSILRCKCKKQHVQCGPSCQCINCKNTHGYNIQQSDLEQESQESENDSEYEDIQQSSDEEKRELNEEVDNIMEEVFGVTF